MNWRIPTAMLAALALGAVLMPTASANVPEADDVVILPCNNPGYQGTIATVPYLILVTGTGWNPYPYYYVYGTTYYQNVNAYNYCVANNQVGAVSLSYGGSYSWQACATCASNVDDGVILLP